MPGMLGGGATEGCNLDRHVAWFHKHAMSEPGIDRTLSCANAQPMTALPGYLALRGGSSIWETSSRVSSDGHHIRA
eukprot:3325956-Rhodomonas_salina.1